MTRVLSFQKTSLRSISIAAVVAFAFIIPSAPAFADNMASSSGGSWAGGGGIAWGFNQPNTQYPLIHENGSASLAIPSTTTTDQGSQSALQTYFNLAHCQCSAKRQGKEQTFAELLSLQGATSVVSGIPGQFWFGAACDQTSRATGICKNSGVTIGDINGTTISPAEPEFQIADLMFTPDEPTCFPQQVSDTLWLLADDNMMGMLDFSASTSITTDTLPPSIPVNFTVNPAENAIELKWQNSLTNPTDLYYFQALCSQKGGANDGMPAFTSPPVSPKYQSARSLCGLTNDIPLTPIAVKSVFGPDAGVVDASSSFIVDAGADAALFAPDAGIDAGSTTPDAQVVTGLPSGMAQGDPSFLCGETAGPSATSMRIEGLTNGVDYNVVLLVMDSSGNAAGAYFTSTIQPREVTDFWEDLHNQGSDVKGGFCLLAETYGDDSGLTNSLRSFRDDTLADSMFGRFLTGVYYDHFASWGEYVHNSTAWRVIAAVLLAPLVVFALVWHAMTLPGMLLMLAATVWLRRRRNRVATRRTLVIASTALLAMIAVPSGARADGGSGGGAGEFDSEWNNSATNKEAPPDDMPKWVVGVKVGPYVPQIDAQLGLNPGPYHEMFGKRFCCMPVIEVDRVFAHLYGDFLVGGSIGVFGESANAFLENSSPSDPNRPRSSGDTTSFRLVPAALLLTYRFTYLDDEYNVPIVPYGNVGLAYYVWWITDPNGNFAKVGEDGCDLTKPGCSANRAAGASLGLQGSLGLSVRAERIDSDAARTMRDSGILHAGLFAEVQFGWVDGFGSSSKLNVGDTTVFGGVNFEF